MKSGIPGTRRRKRGPNGCQDKINRRLRQDIWKGVYQPGARLPTHEDLKKTYHTTSHTIQRALDRLVEDGFARADGPKGTFVADNPPCLSNYAIVYPLHLDRFVPEISFWRVLAKVAKNRRFSPGQKFSLYFGLNGHVDEPDYRKLQQDLSDMRIAGIIFTSNPFMMANTPLFTEIMAKKNLPKVAFMTESWYEIPAVSNDSGDSLIKSLDYLQEQKCRRLAVIHGASDGVSDTGYPDEARMIAEAKKRGITINTCWIQGVNPTVASCARRLTQLLLKGPKEERPDSIMIVDDSLVEPATRGIADEGLTSPRDIHVVGFCNFPELPPGAVPVKFIGLNVETFLDRCIESLERQRAGMKVPRLNVIPSEESEIRSLQIGKIKK